MKRQLLLIVFTVLFPLYAVCQTTDFSKEELLDTGLPLVTVTTVDGVLPTCDYVEAPEGCWGSSITNKTKVPSRLTMVKGNDILYDSGDYVKDKSGLTIALRGNTSAYSPKKSYKLKLQKKADMLLRGNDSKYKDKSWLLIKDDYSMSLNTMVGMKVSQLMGLQWTPQMMFVNLVLNDDYKGVYMLIESVKDNSKCRLDIDSDTGYIMEYDPYWWNEDLSLDEGTYYQYGSMRYTFKYPDAGDFTDEQLNYIQQYIKNVEASIANGTYPEYIDIESFAAWVLTHDIMGIFDGGGSNIYLTKYDNTDGSKLMMANIWDMDTIYRKEGEWSAIHEMWAFYFKWLFESDNKSFVHAYKDKWQEIAPDLLSEMTTFLNDFRQSDTAAALDKALILDGQRWDITPTTVEKDVEKGLQYFEQRIPWLEENIAEIDITSGIRKMKMDKDNKAETASSYATTGQKVGSSHKGITIRGNKKFIKK